MIGGVLCEACHDNCRRSALIIYLKHIMAFDRGPGFSGWALLILAKIKRRRLWAPGIHSLHHMNAEALNACSIDTGRYEHPSDE